MGRLELSAAKYVVADPANEDQCFTCEHYTAGASICSAHGSRVRADHVCDTYTAARGGVAAELSELSHASSIMLDEHDDLVWKDVLVEGTWALSPDITGQPQRVPLRVVAGDAGPGEVSMSELKSNFDEGAIDQVTVPLSHADRPDENTGYVKKLDIRPDADGKQRMYAGIGFTEPDVKEKARRGTIPNVSVGVLFDYMRKRDGKKYKQVLAHTALTSKPWLNGLTPFGALAASQDLEIGTMTAMNFEDDAVAPEAPPEPPNAEPSTDVVWKREGSADWIREAATAALREMKSEDDEYSCYVRDVNAADSTVLVDEDGKSYVAPYAVENGELTMAPRDEWTAAKQEWVAASEQRIRVVVTKDKLSLSEAQDSRKARANGAGSTTRVISKEVTNVGDSTTELTLSEMQDRMAQIEKENRELKEADRRKTVESRVKEIGEMGLSEHPGLLKEIRNIMLSDDGQPALMLSEEGRGEDAQELTATAVVERVIQAMPTKDGRIALSEQAFSPTQEAGGRPPEDASGEKPVDVRTEEVLRELGLETTTGKAA
jgi:hypothetical protein